MKEALGFQVERVTNVTGYGMRIEDVMYVLFVVATLMMVVTICTTRAIVGAR